MKYLFSVYLCSQNQIRFSKNYFIAEKDREYPNRDGSKNMKR